MEYFLLQTLLALAQASLMPLSFAHPSVFSPLAVSPQNLPWASLHPSVFHKLLTAALAVTTLTYECLVSCAFPSGQEVTKGRDCVCVWYGVNSVSPQIHMVTY